MVPRFALPRFPALLFGGEISTLAFSTPALWCYVFHSRVFQPCIFDDPAFFMPAFFLPRFRQSVSRPVSESVTRNELNALQIAVLHRPTPNLPKVHSWKVWLPTVFGGNPKDTCPPNRKWN